MGVKERRSRAKEELRELILEKARDLFAAEGYDAVSMRRIAAAIEYSPTSIYLYFRDKESLVRELCRRDFQMLLDGFARAVEHDPVLRLFELGRKYVEFGVRYPNHYRLMFMTSFRDAAGRAIGPEKQDLAHIGNPDKDGYALLRQVIRQAIEEGRFGSRSPDVDLVAQTLWAGVHGLVALEICKGDERWCPWRPLDKRVDLLLGAVLRGLGAVVPDGQGAPWT